MSVPLIVQSGLRLQQILPEAEVHGTSELVVRRFVRKAWQVRPGDVWVALPKDQEQLLTTRTQGQYSSGSASPASIPPKELALALARGAAAVLFDSPIPEDLPIPLIVVPDLQEAWGRICQTLAGHPTKTLRVIAVTGRFGRTATCWLLKEVLVRAGYRPGVLSPLGYFDGISWHPPHQGMDTPEILARHLARLVRHQCTHAVLDVGSRALAQKALAGMELEVICLCPGGLAPPNTRAAAGTPPFPLASSGTPPACLDSEAYGSVHPAWRTALQTALFRYLKPGGFTVASADDPASAQCLPGLEGAVLTVGQRNQGEITGRLLEAQLAEQTFLVQAGADIVPVRTGRIGKEHITSCLLAAGVGLAYGMDLAEVVRSLEAVQTVPGQLQRIERGQPFAVFLQLLRSPAEVQASLQTLQPLCKGRLWCVAGVSPQQPKKTSRLARLLPRYVDRLLLSVEEHSGPPLASQTPEWAKPILAAFAPPKHACWIPDRGEAIFTALQQAQPGDCVLILSTLGKTYPLIGNQAPDWDDSAVVHTCLEHLYPEHWPTKE